MDVLRGSVTAGHALGVQGLHLQKQACLQSPLGSTNLSFKTWSVPCIPLMAKTGARGLFPSPPSLQPPPPNWYNNVDWLWLPPLTEPVPYPTFPLWAHVNLLRTLRFISLCPTGSLPRVKGPPIAVLKWAGMMLLHRHLEVPSTRVLRTLGLLQNS